MRESDTSERPKTLPVRLDELDPLDSDGHVRVVVESPKGSGTKVALDPELGAFVLGKVLPAGVVFPFDFGFIPGTAADDGDCLDAMVLDGVATYPGVVVLCEPIGAVIVKEKTKGRKGPIRNDRVLLVPVEDPNANGDWSHRLTAARKRELSQFFLSTALFEPKAVEIVQWVSRSKAFGLIEKARRARE